MANYTQGSIQTTDGATDAAIQGNGFFVVQDPNYRSDALHPRRQLSGQFDRPVDHRIGPVRAGLDRRERRHKHQWRRRQPTLPVGTTIPATATTTMNLALNLEFQRRNHQPRGRLTAPIQVYDSQGTSHTLTATYTKTAANTWTYAVTIPPADLTAGAATPSPGYPDLRPNGNLTSPTLAADPQTFSITGLADGAADMTINWNLYNSQGNPTITQYDEASSISGTTQNGYAAGSVSSVALQNGGQVDGDLHQRTAGRNRSAGAGVDRQSAEPYLRSATTILRPPPAHPRR